MGTAGFGSGDIIFEGMRDEEGKVLLPNFHFLQPTARTVNRQQEAVG